MFITFATNAIANGMEVKTLSTIIGHVSATTTLDIYTHSTQAMQQAAQNIDRGICGVAPTATTKKPEKKPNPAPKFEPNKGSGRADTPPDCPTAPESARTST